MYALMFKIYGVRWTQFTTFIEKYTLTFDGVK